MALPALPGSPEPLGHEPVHISEADLKHRVYLVVCTWLNIAHPSYMQLSRAECQAADSEVTNLDTADLIQVTIHVRPPIMTPEKPVGCAPPCNSITCDQGMLGSTLSPCAETPGTWLILAHSGRSPADSGISFF